MEKKGQAEVFEVTLLFELIAAIVIGTFLVYSAISYNSLTDFNKKYIEKDLGLLLNAVYSSPGFVEIRYPVSEQYKVNISGNKVEASQEFSILNDPFNKKSEFAISGGINTMLKVERVRQQGKNNGGS